MIVNRQDRVLVLGKIILRPLGTILVDRSILREDVIIRAEKKGFIEIVNGDSEEETVIEDVQEEIEELEEEIEEELKEEIEESKAVVWDGRAQKLVEAEVVPKPDTIVSVDEAGDKEELLDVFIEKDKIEGEIKKKGKEQKITKSKIEKYSKEKPKAKESLQHLIDDIKSEDVGFVDTEQDVQKLKDRGLIDGDTLSKFFE